MNVCLRELEIEKRKYCKWHIKNNIEGATNGPEEKLQGANLTNLPLKEASFFQIVYQGHVLKAIAMQYFPPSQ
jgi:hypothetical protein